MNGPTVVCPICKLESPDVSKKKYTSGDYGVFNCARCGKFKISGSVMPEMNNNHINRAVISGWTREKNEYEDTQPYLESTIIREISSQDVDKSIDKNVQRILKYLITKSDHFGQGILLNETFDCALIWSLNTNEFKSYIKDMLDKRLIEYTDDDNLGDTWTYTVSYTDSGHKYYKTKLDSRIQMPNESQWPSVDKYLQAAYNSLDKGPGSPEYQNCAHSCREAIVELASQVYDEKKHGKFENQKSSYSNALTKLEMATGSILNGNKNKEKRSLLKNALNFASKYAHSQHTGYSEASTCYSTIKMIVEIVNVNLNSNS